MNNLASGYSDKDLEADGNECETCKGTGYVELGSTTTPEDEDYDVCPECDGEGFIINDADLSDSYRENIELND